LTNTPYRSIRILEGIAVGVAAMETVTVHDAEPADAAAVSAIGRAAVPDTYRDLCPPSVIHSIVEQSYSLQALRKCITGCRLDDDAHFLVAERDGHVVGFLHYDCKGPQPELHRIYVQPALKRTGIGGALMHELHDRLDPGATYILMVVADNLPAVAFYQGHGLVVEAHVDGPSYMHEHMSVSFPSDTAPVPALVLRFRKSRS
jgi:ribosomal protein S18 acetylase RimI-like enzyme